MLKKLAVLALVASAAATGLLASAGPASAEGPRNEQEAAVCSALLPFAVSGSLVDAICVVRKNG
ncbi:hypothetical protein AB0D08_10620 [Kitasatospora sp. NPDC048540]|uniref:hypothetical protein n=1 Tax=unclassified Kitasatospora TaxID=2633591 RepID=UPI00053B4366|nr:hypothetical protein [Kitasatospora sp. MBT63]